MHTPLLHTHTKCTNMHVWSTQTLPSSLPTHVHPLLTHIHTPHPPPNTHTHSSRPSQPMHAATALVFGVPLVDLVTREERAIPYIVQKIVEHMEEDGEEGGREGGRRGRKGREREGEGGRGGSKGTGGREVKHGTTFPSSNRKPLVNQNTGQNLIYFIRT